MYLIKNGFVLESGIGFSKKDVLIQRGKIKKIDENVPLPKEDCEVIGCGEFFWVVPWLIDIHTLTVKARHRFHRCRLQRTQAVIGVLCIKRGYLSFLATTMI